MGKRRLTRLTVKLDTHVYNRVALEIKHYSKLVGKQAGFQKWNDLIESVQLVKHSSNDRGALDPILGSETESENFQKPLNISAAH